MTDARERLVATISDIYAPRSGTTFGWEQRLTDAIADFVCEEIGNGWAKRVVMNSNAIEAALKRLEAVERRLQHGLSCCCPLCRKSWGWTPCENHGVERCSACYPEQPAPAMLAALKACDAYFNQTRSGREWRDNGGSEPLVVRAAITQAEAGRKP